ELYAVDLRGDRLEAAADVIRGFRLRIPEVQVAGAALEVEHDDPLRLAPAGPAAGPALAGRGLQLKHAAQAQAQEARAADAQDVPAGDAEMRVAEVLAGLSLDGDHRIGPFEPSG